MRLVYVGFVLTGTVTTVLGPVLPMLSRRWSLADADAGLLFTAQFVGSMVGVGLSTVLTGRWGATRLLGIGAALMAIGISALTPAGWPASLAFVGCYGVGLGFAIPVTNVLVAEASPHRRAAALNLVNVAWVLGAIMGPAALALLARLEREDVFLPGLGILLAVLAVAFVRRSWTESRPPSSGIRSLDQLSRTRRLLRDAQPDHRAGVCGSRQGDAGAPLRSIGGDRWHADPRATRRLAGG